MAEKIGFPVVLKAQALALPHKSDVGGVILGIADGAALRVAWQRLHDNLARAKPGLALDGVLVETMAPPGIELIVGARRDPEWGPIVMIGLGGVWTEALKDVRLMSPDLDEDAILIELSKLKGAALLAGMRGAPPADRPRHCQGRGDTGPCDARDARPFGCRDQPADGLSRPGGGARCADDHGAGRGRNGFLMRSQVRCRVASRLDLMPEDALGSWKRGGRGT